jgi:hypothetical protein
LGVSAVQSRFISRLLSSSAYLWFVITSREMLS